MTRILACTTQPVPHIGGASTHLLNLRDMLRSSDVPMDILALSDIPIIPRIWHRLRSRAAHRRTGIVSSIDSLATFYSSFLENALADGKYDLLNVQTVFAMLSCIRGSRALGLPKVLTVHGYAAFEADSAGLIKSETELNDLISMEKQAYHAADIILGVDSRICGHIISIAPECTRRTFTWPNTFSRWLVNAFEKTDKEDARKKIGIPPEKFVILCPRRLVSKNGVNVPIAALRLLKKPEQVVLAYAGDGPLKEELRKQVPAKIKNHVLFYGDIDHREMPLFYRAADVAVVPSVPHKGVEEASSISALEAAACGIPLIYTNVGGLGEIFARHNAGIMIPPGDEGALAEAIDSLLEDKGLRKSLGTQLKIVAEVHHSPEDWIKGFIRYAYEASGSKRGPDFETESTDRDLDR